MSSGAAGGYHRPRPLTAAHVVGDFESRSLAQTRWLHDHAEMAHGARSAHVMAVTPAGSDAVVAYYAWSMASVGPAHLPPRAGRGVGHHPQPFALLARLAVDVRHEGRNVGHAMLVDVLARTVEISTEIGCRGLAVHAEGEDARAFYLHALPEFEPSPTDPLHLVALVKDIRRALG